VAGCAEPSAIFWNPVDAPDLLPLLLLLVLFLLLLLLLLPPPLLLLLLSLARMWLRVCGWSG
jgi:hypothetical protein